MPPPGQNPTAVWDGRSLLAGLEVSLKSWAGLPVTVAVVVVVGGLWCGQIACSAKAHALQPAASVFRALRDSCHRSSSMLATRLSNALLFENDWTGTLVVHRKEHDQGLRCSTC